MKLTKIAVLLASAALINVPALAAPPKFKTDVSALSVSKREQFSDVEKLLNDWTGENEKLVAAGVMIDSLIKSDPDFLPTYIEKARLSIMLGATGTNDFAKANRDALKILAEVQKKDRTYAKSYVLAGHAFLNVGDFDNAKKSLEQAERIGTTDPWLYDNWADLLGRLKQYDKALANARKALILSKENGKAMTSAIYFISNYSKFVENSARGPDITGLIFDSFKEPDQRMRVATRLIAAYEGDPTILDHAYKIIERQRNETPHLESADLALVEWFLTKGYRKTQNEIAKYDPQFSLAAEQVLDAIKPSKSANARIFENRFSIALSNNDVNKAGELLKNAEADGVPTSKVMASRALLKWLEGDYASVRNLLEEAAKTDPDFSDSSLLMKAYARLGRTDMLAAYYKSQVDRNPTSAWNLGNYAGFLLFTMHDLDGAIHYGDEALKQMEYPIAQNTTSLAYLMKASTLNREGNKQLARKLVERARSIGVDEEYVYTHCAVYCADIQSVLKKR
jgi:tetratricopeptide (TPR) repeat protein